MAAAAATGGARCAVANPAEATGFDDSRVVTLTPEGFDEQVKKMAPVLVEFYACVLRQPLYCTQLQLRRPACW